MEEHFRDATRRVCESGDKTFFLTGYPGVLLAFPYGFLSDRVGRKKIILTGMLGCVLSDTWARIVCTS
jgi:MFS family permease